MTEANQVRAIMDGAQGVANDLSLAGDHVAALRIAGLIQLTRVLWTRLQPPPAPPEPPPIGDPANNPSYDGILECKEQAA